MAQTGREKIAICALKFCDLTTALGLFTNGSCGVVVITCASHAQGPRFDPGQEQFLVKCTGSIRFAVLVDQIKVTAPAQQHATAAC